MHRKPELIGCIHLPCNLDTKATLHLSELVQMVKPTKLQNYSTTKSGTNSKTKL